MNKKIALIPAKNEEAAIGRVIKELKPYVDEIVVIDGNSTDKTREIADRLGADVFPCSGGGKGSDFSEFLSKYKIDSQDYYVMLDGDASYPVKSIPEIFDVLDYSNVVSGSRSGIRLKPKNIAHFFGNKIISITGLLLYGKFMDICTGMWVFEGGALKKMNISAKGFELEANIFIDICKLKIRHKEIKIDYLPRIGKEKLRESDGFRIIYFLVKEKIKSI